MVIIKKFWINIDYRPEYLIDMQIVNVYINSCSIRRYTQVWLKGSVLKTDRRVKPRGGSNPSTSSINFKINAHKLENRCL